MPYKDDDKQKAYRKAYNASPQHRRAQRNCVMKSQYGITIQEYDDMVRLREGRCDLCKKIPKGKHNQNVLHVDHDHGTGKIRGLLCSSCNRGIGFLREDAELLARAAAYVKSGGDV